MGDRDLLLSVDSDPDGTWSLGSACSASSLCCRGMESNIQNKLCEVQVPIRILAETKKPLINITNTARCKTNKCSVCVCVCVCVTF